MSARLIILSMSLGTVLAATGLAEARPDSRSMSCGEIRAMIQSRRAVVLTTGPCNDPGIDFPDRRPGVH